MSAVWSVIAGALLGLFGWRVEGTLPPVKKMVIIAAHHTSNWDGLLLVLAAFRLRIRIHWMVKHTLMKPGLGLLIRALGGIPIDRTASHGVVDQMVDEFNRRDEMILVISPEGTRKYVTRWKRGFYYIAFNAGVPIVLGTPDYKRKRVIVGPSFMPSGDLEAEIELIREFYEDKTPLYPEKAGDIVLAGEIHSRT